MKMVTKMMVAMLAVLCASCSLVAADSQNATEDIAAFEAGLQAIASKPKLMSAKLLSATSGTTVYPASGSDMNVTGRKGVPLDLYFDVTMASVSSATLYLNAYDVDYPSATERDDVYFNGTYVGRLQGYNNGENMNTFDLRDLVITGRNHVHIDVDVATSGSWVTQMREGTKLVLNGEEGRVTLTVTKDLLNKIELNWSANFSGASPYNIYRGRTLEELTIYREGLTVTSFPDTEVVPGETYYYQIKTKSGVSSTIEEARSIRASVTVTPSQDLYHKVKLSWTAENCGGPFTIYRAQTPQDLYSDSTRTLVAEKVKQLSFTDDKVEGGVDYYYQVVAQIDSSLSVRSDPVVGRNKRAEIDLKDLSNTSGGLELRWSCIVSGLKYAVYKMKRTGQEDVYEQVWPADGKMSKKCRWVDPGCEVGSYYYYYIVSSLGVKSEVKCGMRIGRTESSVPRFEFSMTGGSEAENGLSGEDNVLVAGGSYSVNVKFKKIDAQCIVKRFELMGVGCGGVAKKSHRQGLSCGNGYDGTSLQGASINWKDLTLDSGSGYHGRYVWTLKCFYEFEGAERIAWAEQPIRKNVYFHQEGIDNGENAENWYVYWRDDGACPGLKNNIVFYRGGDKDSGGAYDPNTGRIYIDKGAKEGWNPVVVPNPKWSEQDRRFFVWPDGRAVSGIYKVENTVGHELQHRETLRRYDEMRRCDERGNTINDSDRGLGETGERCVIKMGDREGSTDFCSINTTDNERKICDSIVDEDEDNAYWLGIKGLDKFKADTFGLMRQKFWEYGGYGDDELVAMVAGRNAMTKAKSNNDWSFPGEQAGQKKAYAVQRIESVRTPMTYVGLADEAKNSVSSATGVNDEQNQGLTIEVNSLSMQTQRDGRGLIDRIDYSLGLSMQWSEYVVMKGELSDADGRVVATASTMVGSASNSAEFSFDAKKLYEIGARGPYKLERVSIQMQDGNENCEVAYLDNFIDAICEVTCEQLSRPSCKFVSVESASADSTGIAMSLEIYENDPAEITVVAELVSTNGDLAAKSSVSNVFSVGSHSVVIGFQPNDIYQSGVSGPYELNVQIWSGNQLVGATSHVALPLDNVDYMMFKPANAFVSINAGESMFEEIPKGDNGSLGAITYALSVENDWEDVLDYQLTVVLVGAEDKCVAVKNYEAISLVPGKNLVRIVFPASQIRDAGVDGPYRFATISLSVDDDVGNDVSFRPTVATEAYKASDFAAAAVAFSNEPSAKGVLECDTPTVVLPFEAKRVCTVVASATLIGTNGEFIARASATNRCDAAGVQAAEIVFPREALVAAGQQGPFSVGYFALLPLVDGEEPIYSDTFEVTGIEWIDWEGMFDWAFEGGTAQAALYKGTNGVVRVPSFVKGRDVISVGPCCFLDCECVTEIILPEGIAEVGIGAFFGTSLSAVELPESVATVGNAAFNVEGLELVVFDGPPPMSAPDAYPKGAVGTYRAAYAAAWEAELKGGCLWNGLTMVPEGADADGYRTESGWTVVGPDDATACEGKRTFRSAETADGASSAMTMDVEEQTSVSFWWKTSCEGARMDDWQGDHAEFLIDGVVVERIAGESCWKQVVVNISDPGQHELSWRYVKDGAGASGADCVWVSDVGFATAAGEMTHAELLAEADYNWFYENGPVECGGETPFEYIPEKPLPERTLAQIDILCDLGIRSVVDTEDAEVSDSAQTAFCRCANGEGLDFAVWTADGWMRVGNALVGAQQGEARVTICLDYSVTPSQFACKVNNHTLTNENGQSSFVCAKQDCRVNEIATDSDGAGRIVAWAGRYDASNSEILEIAEGTEAECDSDLSNLPRETFQVSGGGTLVIKGADVPTTGVKARLHVDQNSALRFDYSGFSSLPSVLTLFSGVGNGFMLGGNVSIVVPGEGTDRLSKLCVKDGNLEAHIAERPEIVTEGGSESPFAVDGENGSASLNVGNAVEGFWYGLLTTGVLTSDFVLDPDSVKQCTGTGSLRLESSANANSDSGFYRVSVSAEKP